MASAFPEEARHKSREDPGGGAEVSRHSSSRFLPRPGEEVKKEADEEKEEMEEKKEETVATSAPAKSHTDAIDHIHWLIEYMEGSKTMNTSPPYTRENFSGGPS